MRCPFGCRQAHRKKRSSERSTEYYKTENGKRKKKEQNQKRSRSKNPSTESEKPKEPEKPPEAENPEQPPASAQGGEPVGAREPEPSAEAEDKEPEAAGLLEFDDDMVKHLQVQTSLLEEREVSREEILAMLRRIMRQHSMAVEKRRDYIVRFLKEKEENPP